MTAHRHIVKMKRPAGWHREAWREALMLGNGLTGILVHGAIGVETVQFNRHDLWHGAGDGGDIPDISDVFREMRAQILRGEYAEANTNRLKAALASRGYQGGCEVPYPLGWLRCDYTPETLFREYERGINLRTGEGFVTFRVGETRFTRRMFVSRAADLAVFAFTATEEFTAAYHFELYDGGSATISADEDGRTVTLRSEDGTKGVVLAVAGDCGVVPENGGFTVTGREYRILVKAFSNGSDFDLGDAVVKTYEALFAEHTALHTPLYDSVSVELAPDEDHDVYNEDLLDEAYAGEASPVLLERLWRMGRYLFLSASSEKGYPVPLYGLWHGADGLMWSQYVANENVQMTYWHALSGGLSYALPPLIDYYTGKTARMQECAKKMFGAEGIWLSAYTTPHVSGPTVAVGVISNWISGAGWMARHFWEYFLYTEDIDLLKEKILPFMRETARFYLSYVICDEDGTARICPSVSPENTPGSLMSPGQRQKLDHFAPAVMNATMDFAVMKELLTNLLNGMERTGLYGDEAEDYRTLLSKIPAYQINEDGAVKEWMDEGLSDNYFHRHLSHIYPLFPGCEAEVREDPQLFEAFRRAVHLRELGGQSGWSLAHMANIYARLGEGESAAESLDILAKSVLNSALITTHNDWRHMGMTLDMGDTAPVQLDANFGAVSAVQEMLCRKVGDCIDLLPALPTRLTLGTVRGIGIPGGTVDLCWRDGEVTAVISAQQRLTGGVTVLGQTVGALDLLPGERKEIQWKS